MYIANFLIVSGFVGYFLLIIFSNKKISKGDGFNVTKDILNEYDSINIIENKSYFTIYNIKRKVIKIASKCYYGNSVSDIAIPLMEAGISIVDNKKNKYIIFFSKIVSNLKYLYIFPICAIFLNVFASSIGDAKIGLLIISICILISYILINIKSEGVSLIGNKINKVMDKEDSFSIIVFLNRIILFDKLIFIGELIMIIKFVAIILKMW